VTSPTAEIVTALRRLRCDDLPLPGHGRTADRHDGLIDLARRGDVSIARLAEAHVDAVAICHEAGTKPVAGAFYAVWAAAPVTGADLRIDLDRGVVTGTKSFCSGLGLVDRALVTAIDDEGRSWLVDLEAHGAGVTEHLDTWATVALADTRTGSVELDQHPVTATVGGPGWYLARPGFWHGACGPASCWAGAAIGLVDAAEALADDDPHRRAHLGALRARAWELRALLTEAGHQIDADPDDVGGAERRARAVRHLVERSCTEVLDRFGSAFGPRPMVTDATIAQRAADLQLYLRQDHAERDLAPLGRAALARP
jgi:alkylation response protein AidB-like acyl-CoA dehydrogenase